MELSNKLQDDLRAARVTNARRFRALADIDEVELQRTAAAADEDFAKLAERVRGEISGKGGLVHQEHDQYLKASKRHIEKQFTASVMDPPPSCLCLPIFTASEATNQLETKCDGSCVQNDAVVGPEPNTVHPKQEVNSPGLDGTNTADLAISFEFELEPAGTGEYCIVPRCQLSGHYIAFSWGDCGVDVGSIAHVRVDKEVEVFQSIGDLDLLVYSTSHTVLDVSESGSSTSESGFASNGIPMFGVTLVGGLTTTVRTTCRMRAQVTNLGLAIIDMASSPHFYFRAPEVGWGPPVCFS